MIRLRILGPVALERDGSDATSPLLGQPKRLALLAYLAMRGEQLTPRDTILALFWGEQSQESARHALSQSLYILRRELVEGAIVTRGHALGIDPQQVWCDAAAFDRALRRGDRVAALDNYHGPLLDGFFLSEAPEFERWLAETREELHARAARAARGLAQEAAAHGQADAIGYARRAAALASWDEPAARLLVELLDRSGDRAGALAAYEGFVRRLQAECELQPSADFAALAAAIRSQPAAESPIAFATPIASPVPLVAATRAQAPRDRRPSWARAPLLVALTAVVLVIAWAIPHTVRARLTDSIAATKGRVIVFPFTVDGAADSGRALGRNLAALISARMDGAGSIHAVPADTAVPGARADSSAARSRLGAASTVGGTARVVGNAIHLHVEWRNAGDRSLLAQATVEGPEGALLDLLDDAVRQLIAGAQPASFALVRAAAMTHPSLGALKAFMAGEDAFRVGRFREASRAFERAAAESTFALAQFRFGEAGLWAEDYSLAAADAGERAIRMSAGMTVHQRMVITAFDAWRRGVTDSTETPLVGVVAGDPEDVEAWFLLGENWFHYNPMVGAPVERSHEAFDHVIRIDPDNWGALWHLALLDALDGRLADLDRRLDRLNQLGPQNDYRLEIAVLRGCAHRDSVALAALRPELVHAGEGRIFDLVWRCAVFGRNLPGAISLAQPPLERGGGPFTSPALRFAVASLEMARGRRNAALAQLDTAVSMRLLTTALLRLEYATLPVVPHRPGEIAALAAAPSQASAISDHPDRDVWERQLDGLRALALGHEADVRRIATMVEQQPDQPGFGGRNHALAGELRARLALTAGDAAGAVRELEAQRPMTWFGNQLGSAIDSRGSARFLMAEALERSGRGADAARWYGTLDEFSIADLIYAAPAHLRRAELYRRAGQDSLARVEYARAADLWRDADPDVKAVLARSAGR